jgi:hypothetical protein
MYLSFFAISLLSSFAAAAAATAASYDLAHLRSEPLSDYVPSVKDLASDLARSMMPITRNTTTSTTTTTSIAESRLASNVALQDTLLTGYFKESYYADSGCNILEISVVKRLNTCTYDNDEGFYVLYTATATAITTAMFYDSMCMTLYIPATTSLLTSTCYFQIKRTVSASTEVPSTKGVVYFK